MFVLVLYSSISRAEDLIVHLPETVQATSASAQVAEMKLESAGKTQPHQVTFANVLPETAYDVKIETSAGPILQGVNLNWYNEDAARADAGELNDDDRQEIGKIVRDIPSFYNQSDILQLRGDHDRAVALVQLVRSKDFHSDTGGEVIWRIELWYFRNEAGGWAKISQQNKVLRRERYKSGKEFRDETEKLRWTPELGGITLAKGEKSKTIDLPADVLKRRSSAAGSATTPSPPDAQ
jgi:hypothetical protein